MSKRSQFDAPVIDEEGNALEAIEVTVYESDGVTEATIYNSKSGGGTISNPIETDATGNVSFWSNPGEYVLSFHDTELPIRIADKEIVWSAVSGDEEGIDPNQIAGPIPNDKLEGISYLQNSNDAQGVATSYQSHCSIVLTPGTWLVVSNASVLHGGGSNDTMYTRFLVAGSFPADERTSLITVFGRSSDTRQFIVTVESDTSYALQVKRNGASSSATADTQIAAIQID